MDRDAPAIEHGNFAGNDVETHDGVADVRKTGPGDQTNVTGANNCNFHVVLMESIAGKSADIALKKYGKRNSVLVRLQ